MGRGWGRVDGGGRSGWWGSKAEEVGDRVLLQRGRPWVAGAGGAGGGGEQARAAHVARLHARRGVDQRGAGGKKSYLAQGIVRYDIEWCGEGQARWGVDLLAVVAHHAVEGLVHAVVTEGGFRVVVWQDVVGWILAGSGPRIGIGNAVGRSHSDLVCDVGADGLYAEPIISAHPKGWSLRNARVGVDDAVIPRVDELD